MTDKAAQLEAIEKAIASGVTEFTFDGQTTKYRSLNEMRQIRDELKVATGQSKPAKRSPYFSGFSKGYD